MLNLNRYNRLLLKTPRERYKRSLGFSLIELVVVIAILGILSAIALPRFGDVRKDGQIAQAKNSLVTIVKECNIASIRGKSTTLRDISSANGQLPGFILSSQGDFGDDFLNGDCFRDVAGESKIAINAMADEPTQELALEKLPIYSVTFSAETGDVEKLCKISEDTAYTKGCSATFTQCTKDAFGSPICPSGNGIGTW